MRIICLIGSQRHESCLFMVRQISPVPYQIALNTLDNLKKSGAVSIDLVTISGGTHATAGIPAIVAMIEWFESLRSP